MAERYTIVMKKINLLCVLILLLIFLSGLMSVYLIGYGFGKGFKAGYSMDSAEHGYSLVVLDPDATTLITPTDSLTLSNGREVGFVPMSGMIDTSGCGVVSDSFATAIVSGIFGIANLLFILLAIIAFMKYIVSINKSKIFVSRNARLLRKMGVYLLISAGCVLICGILSEISFGSLQADVTGYHLRAYWQIPWGNALLGLLGLLMSQIWHRGIVMKDEQEYTV